MRRFSIASLLGLVALVAVGLAALAGGSQAWRGLMFLLMFGVLFTTLLGLIFRERRGPRWVGAALFGWGFYFLGLIPWTTFPVSALPVAVANAIFYRANSFPAPPPGGMRRGFGMGGGMNLEIDYQIRRSHSERIGSDLLVLLATGAGVLIGGFLTRGRGGRGPDVPAPG